DVQRVFLGPRFTGRAMRACERRLLDAVNLLVVSSPDFISRYFAPVQRYRGPWHLLENKIAGHWMRSSGEACPGRPRLLRAGKPWVIGWFGVLRCRKTLDLLERL